MVNRLVHISLKSKKILLTFFVILLCFVFSALKILESIQHKSLGSEKVINSNTLTFSREYVEALIRERGGAKAYSELKIEAQNLDLFEQHGLGHTFGELLYNREGVASITVCDSDFSFGCFHSFIIAAIFDKGIPVVDEISSYCEIKYGGSGGHGCIHGIGHGLIEYFGSSEEGLISSLGVCQKIKSERTIMGCRNGVFMEFNYPSPDRDGNKKSARVYDGENPEYPCNIVDSSFKPACYYELGRWAQRSKDSFEEGMDFCNRINESEFKNICLMGIGTNAAEKSYFDPKKAYSICSYLSIENGLGKCIAGAEYIIRAIYPNMSKDVLPCHFLVEGMDQCRRDMQHLSE